MKCEACKCDVMSKLIIGKTEYNLCLNCLTALINLNLSKIQFKSLLKKHTTKEFYLHDDFYDEDGRALQAR